MDQIIPLPFTLSGNMVCREVTKGGGETAQLLQIMPQTGGNYG